MKKSILFTAIVTSLLFVNLNLLSAQINSNMNDESHFGAIVRDYLQNPNKYDGQNSIQDLAGDTWDMKFSEPNINGDTEFGYCVARAGDVNGDGYDDVLIGAPAFDNSKGRVYLYYGGTSMSADANLIITGDTENDEFGRNFTGAGDVNGDGYSDIMIGDSRYNDDTGRVLIYYGGSSMDNVADVILYGEATFNNFGSSVVIASDINHDVYADIIIFAPGYNEGVGKIYIYYGGSIINDNADIILTGDEQGDHLSGNVAIAGDVNGDGYLDILVGAYSYNDFTGRVYLYYGGLNMGSSVDLVMTGEAIMNNFGRSIAGVGDVNGDGYQDVLVGANGYNNSTGRVYLYFGGAFMDNIADVVFNGEEAGESFGISVAGAGDINHDNYSDILVGTQRKNKRAILYYGGEITDNIADVIFDGENNSYDTGNSVAGVGDVNNDGYDDFIFGATSFKNGGGRAFLYYGGFAMDNIADHIMNGEATNNGFGFSVTTTLDINNDGFMDLVIGAPFYDNQTGRVYLYYGGAVLDTIADVILTGNSERSRFGSSLANVGDVNNDRYADLLIGADGYNTSTGQAFLYFGSAVIDTIPDLVFTGEAYFNNFGSCIAGVGDVNNDGYDDFLIGASSYNYGTGRIYLYFGDATLDTIADLIMTGVTDTGYFGYSVAGAGDINRDGYDDIIVGAYSGNFFGSVYLYFGSTIMDTTADVILIGDSPFEFFGFSVAGIGDVNNDGYNDVLVGSLKLLNSIRCHAYLYYGSPNMNNIADIVFIGEETGTYFGSKVAGVGDVNDDGYDDIMVGDFGYNNRGRSYLYYGSAVMDSVADVILTGEAINDMLGYTVDGAGDINADGISDFFVGALRNGDYYNGAAYLYYGSKTLDVYDSGKNQLSRPVGVQLQNNYPNPFNPATTIAFELPERANVQIVIYDISGRKVRTLLHDLRNSGQHQVSWDGRDDSGAPVSSGVYLCEFSTDRGFTETKKLTLVK